VNKTNLKSNYLRKLASVNDQLCYFHFADEEVGKLIEELQVGDKSKTTTEIFPTNEFSKRIRVKFDELLQFRDSSKATTAGMSVSFGTEHLLYYLEDVIYLKLKISPVSESSKKYSSPEERMLNNLTHWGITNVDTGIIKAIKYLRLRRNHIIHANSKINEKFERFLKKESYHLNKYWSARTSIDGLDFSDRNVGKFTVNEVYTCMKLLRVCLEEIDILVGSTFKNKI